MLDQLEPILKGTLSRYCAIGTQRTLSVCSHIYS